MVEADDPWETESGDSYLLRIALDGDGSPPTSGSEARAEFTARRLSRWLVTTGDGGGGRPAPAPDRDARPRRCDRGRA